MPGKDGVQVVWEINAEKLPTRIVLLTAEIDEDQVVDAMRLGVKGIVLKEMAPKLLVQCVRQVNDGELWIERRLERHALERMLSREPTPGRSTSILTPSETNVVRLAATGFRNKEIAEKLFVSEGTVTPSKRLFDIVAAVVALVILSPVIALLAILVRIFVVSPVLFLQKRPGYRGKPFSIIKFRTMTESHDADGNPLSDSQRVTVFGRRIRELSLDELPELFNILRGDMSFVGPRPLLMQYLPLYNPDQFRRHEVHPGLTGWAQVNGRNALDWPSHFRLDVWYVDHWSFWLDMKILIITAWKVVKREGIRQPGKETVAYFTGNRD